MIFCCLIKIQELFIILFLNTTDWDIFMWASSAKYITICSRRIIVIVLISIYELSWIFFWFSDTVRKTSTKKFWGDMVRRSQICTVLGFDHVEHGKRMAMYFMYFYWRKGKSAKTHCKKYQKKLYWYKKNVPN